MTLDSITSAIWAFFKALLSPASFAFGSFKIEGPVMLVFPGVIALVVLSIASFVWLYKDAKKRSKHGLIAIVFVLLTGWPVSFIWWFWLRPPIPQKATPTAP
jgi:hypothetical protein